MTLSRSIEFTREVRTATWSESWNWSWSIYKFIILPQQPLQTFPTCPTNHLEKFLNHIVMYNLSNGFSPSFTISVSHFLLTETNYLFPTIKKRRVLEVSVHGQQTQMQKRHDEVLEQRKAAHRSMARMQVKRGVGETYTLPGYAPQETWVLNQAPPPIATVSLMRIASSKSPTCDHEAFVRHSRSTT